MMAKPIKAGWRSVHLYECFCRKQFVTVFLNLQKAMYPNQRTGDDAWEIWKEVSNICSIILLTMLTTELVSSKQNQELHWLQDTYILPPNHRQKVFCTELFLHVRLTFLKIPVKFIFYGFIFIRAVGLKPARLLKNESLHRYFSRILF